MFRMLNGVRVLIYHSISDEGLKIDIPYDKFKDQIKYLYDNYKIISYDHLVNNMTKKFTDDRYVVLTFDDGYLDYYTHVVPFLEKYNIPSTVFVITKTIYGSKINFGKIKNRQFLSVREIEVLKKMKIVNIGSHTHTHRNLTLCDEKLVDFELKKSYEILSSITGRKNIDFCYPWGAFNKATSRFVKKYYRSAAVGKGLVIKRLSYKRKYFIPRIPIKNESFRRFKMRINGFFLWEDLLRDMKLKLEFFRS